MALNPQQPGSSNIPRLRSPVNCVHQRFHNPESDTIKRTIPEDEAQNWISEIYALVLAHYPDIDPDEVSRIAVKCVKDRVQITRDYSEMRTEMVLKTSFHKHLTIDPSR